MRSLSLSKRHPILAVRGAGPKQNVARVAEVLSEMTRLLTTIGNFSGERSVSFMKAGAEEYIPPGAPVRPKVANERV